MDKFVLAMVFVFILVAHGVSADPWKTWPPREYLVRSLVESIPKIVASYHPDTGRFGTEPWICRDQNHIFPLAVAWALEDDANPYYHDDAIL